MDFSENKNSKVNVNSRNTSEKSLSDEINSFNRTVEIQKILTNNELLQNNENRENSEMDIIKLEDIPKSAFSWRGALPYLTDAISALCTKDPKDENGEFVIKNRHDETTMFYSAKISRETLIKLATNNDYSQWDYLLRELKKGLKNPPTVFVRTPKGLYYAQAINPLGIKYKEADDLTEQEKIMCEQIGGKIKIVDYVEFVFFKPLFADCFPKNKATYGGYIKVPIASYAKFHKIAEKLQIEDSYISTYYSFALWFLTHISSNEKAQTLTLDESKIIELLQGIAPTQTRRKGNRYYLKDKNESVKFITNACKILNAMAKAGLGEDFKAIPECCNVSTVDGLQIVIGYKTNKDEKTHANAKEFTSNVLQ